VNKSLLFYTALRETGRRKAEKPAAAHRLLRR
jgi:hypothetical protein